MLWRTGGRQGIHVERLLVAEAQKWGFGAHLPGVLVAWRVVLEGKALDQKAQESQLLEVLQLRKHC